MTMHVDNSSLTSDDDDTDIESASEEEKTNNETASEDTESSSDDEADPEDHSNDRKFPITYQIKHEEAVSLQNIYVLHLSAVFETSTIKLVAGLSDFQCSVYDITNNFYQKASFQAHDDVITGVKLTQDDNLFYTSSVEGTIKLWDLRDITKPSSVFKDDTDGDSSLKPINCFDLSCDGKFIGAGTLVVDADAYVLFWDTRNPKVLGGYWESHVNDVTDIKFNPVKPNLMLSSSLDGLINEFDIGESNEDDALQHSLNVESSIRQIQWINIENQNRVGCITDMETVQFWNIDNASPYSEFSRKLLGSTMYVRSADNAYISNIHQASYEEGNDVVILGGSNVNKGEYLKSLNIVNDDLKPFSNFVGNKQIVRCSCYKNDVFVTGGESGIISLWETTESYPNKMQLKERTKIPRPSR